MSNNTVLGMKLEGGFVDDERIISPLEALVIAKGMDNSGEVTYSVMCTEDMSPVTSAGLLAYGKTVIDWLMLNMCAAREEEDED
jgi:hypothetical protein